MPSCTPIKRYMQRQQQYLHLCACFHANAMAADSNRTHTYAPAHAHTHAPRPACTGTHVCAAPTSRPLWTHSAHHARARRRSLLLHTAGLSLAPAAAALVGPASPAWAAGEGAMAAGGEAAADSGAGGIAKYEPMDALKGKDYGKSRMRWAPRAWLGRGLA